MTILTTQGWNPRSTNRNGEKIEDFLFLYNFDIQYTKVDKIVIQEGSNIREAKIMLLKIGNNNEIIVIYSNFFSLLNYL
jgi:hypothetical protein